MQLMSAQPSQLVASVPALHDAQEPHCMEAMHHSLTVNADSQLCPHNLGGGQKHCTEASSPQQGGMQPVHRCKEQAPAALVAWLPRRLPPQLQQLPSRLHALVGEPPQHRLWPSCCQPQPPHSAWQPARCVTTVVIRGIGIG